MTKPPFCARCWHRASDHSAEQDPHELAHCLLSTCACREYQDAAKTILDREDELARLRAALANAELTS